MRTLKGKSASPGVVIAKALVIKEERMKIEKKSVANIEAERNRFKKAIEQSKVDLEKIRDRVQVELGSDKSAIFEAHLMILQDPELLSATEDLITNEKLNADYAFRKISQQFISMFEAMDNTYMRERALDVRDISDRVLRTLLGYQIADLSVLFEDVILVAHDLTPSETATMDKNHVKGILTNIGGKTSHTAIMARTLEIPAVLGLKDITDRVKNGDLLCFNGDTGEVFIQPNEQTLHFFEKLKEDYVREREEILAYIGKPSVSKDGKKVEIAANIGTPQDLKSVKKYDAEGVGLYRTEFLFMDREQMPSEDEQFEAYKVVLESMNSKLCVIRTLDVGGDKEIPYLNLVKEDNPFLGYRAVRFCLDNPEVFKIQLRALLRASRFGNLGIMFPMISSLDEVIACRKMLDECREELRKKGHAISDHIQVGIMIEIPSAALISDILAQHVDFLSIGTNDLIQYTCAVDRLNEKVQNLYDPYHPAVLRLIQMIIEKAHAHKKWVGMCGEMAGNIDLVPVLLGFGLDEWSMAPTSILQVRKALGKWTVEESKGIASQVLKMATGSEVENFLKPLHRN